MRSVRDHLSDGQQAVSTAVIAEFGGLGVGPLGVGWIEATTAGAVDQPVGAAVITYVESEMSR